MPATALTNLKTLSRLIGVSTSQQTVDFVKFYSYAGAVYEPTFMGKRDPSLTLMESRALSGENQPWQD